MAFFSWNTEYEFGIPEIDEQHQKLVGMISDLYDAMSHGLGSQMIGLMFIKLAKHATTHFATEEDLMARVGYPDLAKHKAEHESFSAKLADIKQRHASGEASLNIEMADWIKTWLTTHMFGTDRLYVPHVTEAKVG